ncbi:DUF3164 family protein [Phenylobacterium sp.]|uniref:DUF3164 family protein n=1 Tax=Phenylobacterium sp. TaxID=1871053 RepID=UPI0035B0F5E4
MTEVATQPVTVEAALAEGREDVNGKTYLVGMKGELVPQEIISAQDLLMDETVRKIFFYARELSDQVARFKKHTADDIYAHLALLAQEYGVVRGGPKGNVMLISHDGLKQIKVRTADRVTFGPELQAAKALVDECLRDWSADAVAELRGFVTTAFQVDKQGDVSPARMFALLRHNSTDERWQRAMRAIRDSIRPIGTKEYFNFYQRASHGAPWTAVTIDLAAA